MSARLLLTVFLLMPLWGVAETIDLTIGKPIPKEARSQLQTLDAVGSGGEIIKRVSGPSIMVDRSEYVSKDGKFVVATEEQLDRASEASTRMLTAVYFSNSGRRVPKSESGTWKWSDLRALRIDTTKWEAHKTK